MKAPRRRRLASIAVASVVSAAGVAMLARAPAASSVSGYAMRPLALPAGVSLAPSVVRPLAPPLALAANGAVAALVVNPARAYSVNRIVVWRADGTRTMLHLPTDAVLKTALRHYETPTKGFPGPSFGRVVLADDGTPFATVMSNFSGGYSGTDKGVFRWTGTRWTVVEAYGDKRDFDTPTDYDVVAAELPKLRVAMSADYSGLFVQIDAMERDPQYQLPEAWVLDGTTTRKLGFGRMTSLAGDYASGYIGEANHRAMPDVNIGTQHAVALLWRNGRRTRLGPGIAFAVNRHGTAVGDDRSSVDGSTQTTTRTTGNITTIARSGIPDGVPTSWSAGKKITLAKRVGTAYTIGDDGAVVGTFADATGFVVRKGTLRRLDRTLVRGGHVTGAYAIDARGRILVTTLTAGARGVAVLDPSN